MADFRVIADALKMGSALKVKKMVAAALEEGAAPVDILNNSLVVGMSEIGTLFKNNEAYVPEVLIAARDEGGHGHNKAAYHGFFDSLCSAQFAELFMCLRAPAAYAICSPAAPMRCKAICQHSAKLCLAG